MPLVVLLVRLELYGVHTWSSVAQSSRLRRALYLVISLAPVILPNIGRCTALHGRDGYMVI